MTKTGSSEILGGYINLFPKKVVQKFCAKNVQW